MFSAIKDTTQLNHSQDKSLALWDEAIEDATRKLQAAKRRVKRLTSALNAFKRNKELGRPWPGSNDSATQS